MNTNSKMAPILCAVINERERYMRSSLGRYPDQLVCHPACWERIQHALREYNGFHYPLDVLASSLYGMQLVVCAGLPVDSFVVAKAQTDVH